MDQQPLPCSKSMNNNFIRLLWQLYWVIFTVTALTRALALVHPKSDIHLFYQILLGFRLSYSAGYWLNILQSMSTLVHCVALLFFIFGIRTGGPALWWGLFLGRILLDVCGNQYTYLQFKSYFFSSNSLAVYSILAMLGFHLPSYFASLSLAIESRRESRSTSSAP